MDTCGYGISCPAPPPPPEGAHTLPFTGFEAIMVLVLAAVIIGCGIALRVVSR